MFRIDSLLNFKTDDRFSEKFMSVKNSSLWPWTVRNKKNLFSTNWKKTLKRKYWMPSIRHLEIRMHHTIQLIHLSIVYPFIKSEWIVGALNDWFKNLLVWIWCNLDWYFYRGWHVPPLTCTPIDMYRYCPHNAWAFIMIHTHYLTI